MQTIVITSTDSLWANAQKVGSYSHSTINSNLSDVGFIHATKPAQTVAMLNRHFTDRNDIILLLTNLDAVDSEVKFEKPLSGKDELFPHIYGPLNINAVYATIQPKKNSSDTYIELEELVKAQ